MLHPAERTGKCVRLLLAAPLLGALLLAGLAAPCPAQEAAIPRFWEARERPARPDLSARPRLRFLTAPDFPPFNSLDGNGNPVGFNIDLARAICTELDLAARCEIQALPWSELRPALERGEGEAIIAGLAITAETRAVLAFSRPYLRFPGRFVTAKAAALEEPMWKTLRGLAVGVAAGSAHERFLRERFAGVSVKAYPDNASMLADLAAGRLPAAFGDGMRLSLWLNGAEGSQCCRFAGGPYLAPDYFGQGLAIATRRDDRALVAGLDFSLHEIGVKNRFAELYLRWFPVGFF